MLLCITSISHFRYRITYTFTIILVQSMLNQVQVHLQPTIGGVDRSIICRKNDVHHTPDNHTYNFCIFWLIQNNHKYQLILTFPQC